MTWDADKAKKLKTYLLEKAFIVPLDKHTYEASVSATMKVTKDFINEVLASGEIDIILEINEKLKSQLINHFDKEEEELKNFIERLVSYVH